MKRLDLISFEVFLIEKDIENASCVIVTDTDEIIIGNTNNSIEKKRFFSSEKHVFSGHLQNITSLIVTNELIITAANDSTMRLWNILTKQQEMVLDTNDCIISLSIDEHEEFVTVELSNSPNLVINLLSKKLENNEN